ncbi:Integrase catalytic region [Thiorhodococcus drewsii AZ1]|uniref:Integrase catalytic region n=1 Tax=Thiorhodococcus drewsii AZ1 TaxID=765913 RepID=G2E8P7_9GAMM|nr:Integrase catalytic region [Thiorhodococcus drewsii AZ1]
MHSERSRNAVVVCTADTGWDGLAEALAAAGPGDRIRCAPGDYQDAVTLRVPAGQHRFDQVCSTHAIEHRLIKPRTPQTNGMVERFNGRIAEVLATTRFDSSQSLEQTITRYVQVYNQHIPQKALGHIAPIQALKDWAEKRPELFKKRVYNLRGFDE